MALEPYPESLPRERRRAQGAFYTPAFLVHTVVDETLAPARVRAPWDGPAPRLAVLDPACGDGRFLVACAERIVGAAAARGHAPEIAWRAAVGRCLVGVERDPAAAARAR